MRIALGGREILSHVDADFVQRGINALIGPNGAGKTTLLRALLGLIPHRGTVEFRTRPDGRMPRLAYVPQRFDFDRGTPITVRDLLCADRQRRPLFLGHARAALRAARDALALVGAERLFQSSLGRLSGGELQRVLVALAMLGDPDVIFLDEPVAGVDIAGEALFCDLLVKLRDQRGVTVILVSHELSIVTQHTDHVVCINDGVVQCQGDTLATLSAANIRRVFGEHSAIYEHGAAQPGAHEAGAAACAHDHHHPHHHAPPPHSDGG
ncbi:MAG: Zinc import ATP-binding protein ZnuC [Phycisphaerae bacterium]|nr:Zinc import ATP-binding protein ZnuC [Phycisphaerae bacterium]